ncbi:uncharacterized protein [Macrobrachium rosenbergii]|uniref:uncharacterized protein n=1 Tax=Macrobrachium rosenbergii TaxID=79674 RepID=UPI0034D6EC12
MTKSTLAFFFFFLAVASITRGHDAFVEKFAYTRVMATCVGEEIYYGWVAKVIAAKKQCYLEPVKTVLKHGVQRREALAARLEKREALFEGPYLKKLLNKAISKASNFTCVMQKLNYADADLRLLPEAMKNEVKNLTSSATFNADMVKIVDYCNQFSTCLPDEGLFPMPIQVKRLLAFMKCGKKLRMTLCMKQHILKNMDHFDVSGLPSKGSDQEEVAEEILHILWGSEEKEGFEIY